MASTDDNIRYFKDDDPNMAQAREFAHATFRYFWREMSWERRRILPAVDAALVKAAFSDDFDADDADVEHMWVHSIDFDGETFRGELANAPNTLKSVSEGDDVEFPFERMGDWIYAIEGKAYGAHTVRYIRKQLSPEQQAQHDEAWGMDFGDPNSVALTPQGDTLAKQSDDDHEMSINMMPKLIEFLDATPAAITSVDEAGMTLLHSMTLAGSYGAVDLLIERGADVNATAKNGMTPLAMAKAIRWNRLVETLSAAGGK